MTQDTPFTPERSKYHSDRRDWVRYVDRELPNALARAIERQNAARESFDDSNNPALTLFVRTVAQEMAADLYREARVYLWRVLYLQAMRRVNYVESDWTHTKSPWSL